MQGKEETKPELSADDLDDWTISVHFYAIDNGSRKVNGRDVMFHKGQYIGGMGRSVRRTSLAEMQTMADMWMAHDYDAMKQIRVIGSDSKPAYEIDNFNKFK